LIILFRSLRLGDSKSNTGTEMLYIPSEFFDKVKHTGFLPSCRSYRQQMTKMSRAMEIVRGEPGLSFLAHGGAESSERLQISEP
jgi:hypothetical protein